MPPKKAPRPAQENISLGPQVREGEFPIYLETIMTKLVPFFC